MRRVKVFMPSEIWTDCDLCGLRFHLNAGGVCVKCRRALCASHLHGSWVRRLLVDLGASPVCLECRAQRA